jgi:hypothetical protein
LLLLSAPAAHLLFSMIAHSGLRARAFLETPMTPRPNRPLLAATLGMSIPKGSVHDSGLLIECQTGSMTVGCVSEQVPCAAVKAKRADIRPGAVGCFVACLTLG